MNTDIKMTLMYIITKFFRYILMENIRFLLHQYDPKKSLFVGEHIMSKKALKDMTEKVFPLRKNSCDSTAISVGDMTSKIYFSLNCDSFYM